MKKILCFVTSLAMCGMFAVNAQAAGGITADEQKVLDNLNSGVVVEGATVSIPTVYINQAQTYLTTNDVTADQVVAINTEIDSVKQLMKDNKITDVAEIKGDLATSIIAHVNKAADVLGVTLTVDTDKTVTVVAKTGKVILTADKAIIKDTGDDYSMMVVMTGAIALILAGASIVASKKGYLSK